MKVKVEEKSVAQKQEEIKDAIRRFDWLVSFMICRFKFVHTVLGITVKKPDFHIPTIGVWVLDTGKFELLYNPDFVKGLSDQELTYILFHEVMHIALHHCTRRLLVQIVNKKRMTAEEAYFFRIANIATDLAVNELIPIDDACKPPEEDGKLMGCHVKEFKKEEKFKDIKERQTSEWYYDFLLKIIKKEGESGKGKGEEGESFDDHGGWEEHEIADERVAQKINEISKGDGWGDVTQTFKELVMAAQIKKINWRNKIRSFFGNLAWKTRQSTRKRPNRRYGYVHPGQKKSYVDRWLVAADTSGSIDSALLGEWLGVVNQLAEEIPIDFMQFDCEKTEDPWPYDRRKVSLDFKGRGGTNFQPVIDIVNEKRYKGLMILTDGEASAPDKPRNCSVLWVMPKGCTPPVQWGDNIYMESNV